MRTAAEIARDNDTITYSAGIAPPVAGSRYDCAWLDHPPATYKPAHAAHLVPLRNGPAARQSRLQQRGLVPAADVAAASSLGVWDGPQSGRGPSRPLADATLQMRVEPNLGGRPCPPGSSPTSTGVTNGSRPTTASTPNLGGRGG